MSADDHTYVYLWEENANVDREEELYGEILMTELNE